MARYFKLFVFPPALIYPAGVSKKSARVTAILETVQGQISPPHILPTDPVNQQKKHPTSNTQHRTSNDFRYGQPLDVGCSMLDVGCSRIHGEGRGELLAPSSSEVQGDGRVHENHLDARYLGYFACFNRQLFFEAHEVLEDLWLADRHGSNGNFYKGLIQLAGAFVHLQKHRLRPSAALFRLAQANFEQYPARHEKLNLAAVQMLMSDWLVQLERGAFHINPLTPHNLPQLALQN
jgi:hypothetical protein